MGRDKKVKLTQRKIRYIIRHKERGDRSNRRLSIELRISVSTVKRVWSYYLIYGDELPLKRSGRPRMALNDEERKIIVESHIKYRLGARRLEKVIERDYGIHIPHNRIHRYLLEEGLAREEPKKKRRRKPYIRYEREHSMSAGHIDWYDKGYNGSKFCAILDDASRKILSAGEFDTMNTENSILVVRKMIEEYWDICPLRELILDRGSPFGTHLRGDKTEWKSQFKAFLEEYGIRSIVIGLKHPQTNGKIEKFFDCYRRYRG